MPNTSYRVLGHNGGDVAKGPNDGGLWWQIEHNNAKGWVAHRSAAAPPDADPDENVLVKVENVENLDNLPVIVNTNADTTGGGGMGSGRELYVDQPDPTGSEPVPTAGRLRAWPSLAATELTASVQADVWYEVRHLYAHTGLGDLWLEVAPAWSEALDLTESQQ